MTHPFPGKANDIGHLTRPELRGSRLFDRARPQETVRILSSVRLVGKKCHSKSRFPYPEGPSQ